VKALAVKQAQRSFALPNVPAIEKRWGYDLSVWFRIRGKPAGTAARVVEKIRAAAPRRAGRAWRHRGARSRRPPRSQPASPGIKRIIQTDTPKFGAAHQIAVNRKENASPQIVGGETDRIREDKHGWKQ